MFNLNAAQARTIRIAGGSAFAFWLFSQIADAHLYERLWWQAAVITVGAAAVGVVVLEGAKSKAGSS
jgi:hypothetical protein